VGYRILRHFIGAFLLVVAALKMAGSSTLPVSGLALFSSPQGHAAIIGFEILLGLWLITGSFPFLSRLAGAVTFALFGMASFYIGISGQADCGCFGSLHVSPWYAFAFDILALALLTIVRPQMTMADQARGPALLPVALRMLRPAIISAVILFLVGLLSIHTFGSLNAALAYLRSESISAEPGVVDLGAGQIGEARDVEIVLTNWSHQAVKIVGGTADCTCITTRSLPVSIVPGQPVKVVVHFKFKGTPGRFERTAWMMTDSDTQRFLRIRLVGHVTQPRVQLTCPSTFQVRAVVFAVMCRLG
jgi:hypothetical protein